jgi:uncharacterized protein YeaO (DUF488 family)
MTASGRIRTKRWDDPVAKDDGLRLLVTRFRPRGVRHERETWDEWRPQLAPSEELHAEAYGKRGPTIAWETYRDRYLAEMRAQVPAIHALAAKVRAGETVTLLCSTACTDAAKCHRSLLRALVYEVLGGAVPPDDGNAAEPLSGLSPKLRDWLK